MTAELKTTDTPPARHRWWMFWKWSPRPYRGRRDRLSPESQGDSANYSMRSGL